MSDPCRAHRLASVEGEFLNPDHGLEGAPEDIHAESIGADTAGNRAVTAIDCLRDQSFHSRTVFLVECVGSKSNYLPLQVGTLLLLIGLGANDLMHAFKDVLEVWPDQIFAILLGAS